MKSLAGHTSRGSSFFRIDYSFTFFFFLFVYEGNLSKFYFLFFGYCSLSEALDLLDYNLRFDAPFKPW